MVEIIFSGEAARKVGSEVLWHVVFLVKKAPEYYLELSSHMRAKTIYLLNTLYVHLYEIRKAQFFGCHIKRVA
jgi:hypothetical protein